MPAWKAENEAWSFCSFTRLPPFQPSASRPSHLQHPLLSTAGFCKASFSVILGLNRPLLQGRKVRKSFGLLILLFSPSAATRETSFVHAISSAGVMHTLTRNCSMGDFENCGCDDSRNGHAGEFGLSWDYTPVL